MKKSCNKKEKININKQKENIVCSLFEIENFLCNFSKVAKGIKLYNVLKR